MPPRKLTETDVYESRPGYQASEHKATFVNKAVSVPDKAIQQLLGDIGDKKVYFRAIVAERSTQVLLRLIPSFDDKCAPSRLKSWRVNSFGRRRYISSVTILRALKLTESQAQDAVMPFDIKDGAIVIPFPKKVEYK